MKKTNNENKTGIYIDSDLYKDSYDYYSGVFVDMPAVSWNWSAFWFGFSWFAYRKMYIGAAAFAMLDAFGSGLMILSPENAALISTLLVVFHLICGLFGNALYYLHVKRLSAKISDMNKGDAKAFVRKNGGSSIPAVVVFTIISSLFTAIFQFIAEMLISV